MPPIVNLAPLLGEIRMKEAELETVQQREILVLAKLERLEVCDETRAIFQRYISGELTLLDLGTAIDLYVRRKGL